MKADAATITKVKAGIAAYEREQRVFLRLLRKRGSFTSAEFDSWFRRPRRLYCITGAGINGEAFILGAAANGFNRWAQMLDLLQYMMALELVEAKQAPESSDLIIYRLGPAAINEGAKERVIACLTKGPANIRAIHAAVGGSIDYLYRLLPELTSARVIRRVKQGTYAMPLQDGEDPAAGTTYSIACRDCQKSLWIGLRVAGATRPYIQIGNRKTEKALEDFLANHAGHPLVFDGDHALKGYERVSVNSKLGG